MKYYAVKKGRKEGIYSSWEECKEQVLGYEGAEYKSFSSRMAAAMYLNGEEEHNDHPFAYIDGSYDAKSEAYSFGGVFVVDGKILQFKKAYPKDEFSKHRNVAGEIKGAGFIIQYAIHHEIKELDIYYDYIGIEKWYTGEWQAKEKISILYSEFALKVKDKIKVNFHKVKSHSNVYYNEMADHLAKEALGIG